MLPAPAAVPAGGLGRRLRTFLLERWTGRILLAARSAAALVRRRHDLDAILAEDVAGLQRAKLASQALAARRAEADADRAEVGRRAREADDRLAAARGKRALLGRLHDRILGESDLRRRTVGELEQAHARLSELIDRSRAAAFRGKSVFALQKGHLPFPTRGLVEVGFGKVVNPKFQTVTSQKGLDIRAPEGTPVTAVAPGRVVHAGWFRGYGNLVIVDHGDGYHTLAGHLAGVAKAVGDAVAAGDLLGTVGETGSIKGAYLYFEVRQRGRPLDPAEWLGRGGG